MERLIHNLHVLWRAESLMIGLKVQRALKQGALLVCAGLAGLFALAMLNVAGFYALRPGMGEVVAAVLMATADFLIAVLAMVLARGIPVGAELQLAMEVREGAMKELEAELAAMQVEIRAVREELSSVKTAVTSFIHRPLDSPLLAMILPLVRSIIKTRRHPDEK